MTYEQFVFWLKGYLESKEEFKAEDVMKINEKVKLVNPNNFNSIVSTYPYTLNAINCDVNGKSKGN